MESSLTYIVDDNDKLQQYTTYSTDLVKGYLDQNITADDIQKVIKSDGTISDDDVIELLANDVVKRIVKYQNTYFKWWYLIICLGIGAVGYYLPLLLLYSRKSLMKMAQENEVTQFRSIICMLMHIPEMTPDVILNWMCRFSSIFRDSLTKCQFRLGAGDTDALEELKEDEPFIPFQRIIDSLIYVTRLPFFISSYKSKFYDNVSIYPATFTAFRVYDRPNDAYRIWLDEWFKHNIIIKF